MTLGRPILRVVVGGLMLGHGLQKLKGSFGGPGLAGTEQMMGAIGLHPAKEQALAAALTETVGGGLTALGFLSPLGPTMITGAMAVAIKQVHGKNGVWAIGGGYEYNLTLIAAALALAADGPGPLSIDGLIRQQRQGVQWGLLAAVIAAAGTVATLAVADKFKPLAAAAADDSPPSEDDES